MWGFWRARPRELWNGTICRVSTTVVDEQRMHCSYVVYCHVKWDRTLFAHVDGQGTSFTSFILCWGLTGCDKPFSLGNGRNLSCSIVFVVYCGCRCSLNLWSSSLFLRFIHCCVLSAQAMADLVYRVCNISHTRRPIVVAHKKHGSKISLMTTWPTYTLL